MGKLTISMAIIPRFLSDYQAGYLVLGFCHWEYPLLSGISPNSRGKAHQRLGQVVIHAEDFLLIQVLLETFAAWSCSSFAFTLPTATNNFQPQQTGPSWWLKNCSWTFLQTINGHLHMEGVPFLKIKQLFLKMVTPCYTAEPSPNWGMMIGACPYTLTAGRM